MTPAARHAAAIEVLDQVNAGTAAEAALTRWARASRFAGSKDRAAVRDIVFACLRQRRSCAWEGGADTGRGLVLGGLRLQGIDPDEIFGVGGYGPAALEASERASRDLAQAPEAVRLDCPDWCLPQFRDVLGDATPEVLETLRHRAPVGLRVNARKGDRASVLARLEADGFAPKSHPDTPHGLTCAAARGLDRHPLHENGAFEFQDIGAQILVDHLPVAPGDAVLDYCAGGGGKSLALAARHDGPITAHDAAPARLAQLAPRARRAGVAIAQCAPGDLSGQFDGIILDVPCSGSGAWRRQADTRWSFDEARMQELNSLQADILRKSLKYLHKGGWIAYMTCSLFHKENAGIVASFLAEHPGFQREKSLTLIPDACQDGFHLSLLRG